MRIAPAMLAITASVLFMGLPGFAGPVQPVSAASGQCTNWTSRDQPPQDIAVYRVNEGRVERVDFKLYVARVAAREWNVDQAELRKSGAVAVKQYAWFYSVAGNHRPGYVTDKGECYDVSDGTNDQIYRPEQVSVGSKIWQVVDGTWGLSVRKSGYLFLTGYRGGASRVCASDVDGRRLYAKSVINCAHIGWSREQIQTIYYGPDVTFHWATPSSVLNPPLDVPIDPPVPDLRTGMKLGEKHSWVVWDQNLARPAGASYHLQRMVNGNWSDVALADPTRPRIALNLKSGGTHQFRVRLRDSGDRTGPWHKGPRFDAVMVQDDSDRMRWTDGWQREDRDAAAGNGVTFASLPDSQSALFFTGRAVAVVSTMGPDRGRARIVIDGTLEGEVDLYSPTHRWQVLVFTREWAASNSRVIRVDVEGTTDRPRVDIDGVLFYR